MKAPTFFLLNSLVFSCLAEASPWGLPKGADIKPLHGTVGICIPGDEPHSVAVESASVSESYMVNGIRQTMWQIELQPNAIPVVLKPGDCLAYGESLSGYWEGGSPKELLPGVFYYFRLNRLVESPSQTSTLFYDAVFCPAIRDRGLIYLQRNGKASGQAGAPCAAGEEGK